MTNEEIAWVAGLFEGEGSFFLNRIRKKGVEYVYPCAAVKMTDEEVVRRIHRLTGMGTVSGPMKRNGRLRTQARWKDIWQWRVHGREQTALFVAIIAPWLCARRIDAARRVLGIG